MARRNGLEAEPVKISTNFRSLLPFLSFFRCLLQRNNSRQLCIYIYIYISHFSKAIERRFNGREIIPPPPPPRCESQFRIQRDPISIRLILIERNFCKDYKRHRARVRSVEVSRGRRIEHAELGRLGSRFAGECLAF